MVVLSQAVQQVLLICSTVQLTQLFKALMSLDLLDPNVTCKSINLSVHYMTLKYTCDTFSKSRKKTVPKLTT